MSFDKLFRGKIDFNSFLNGLLADFRGGVSRRFFSHASFLILFSVLILSSCSAKSLPVKNLRIEKSDGTFVEVKAEIAEKEEERSRGFMFRKNIPDGTGMLFVFENDQILSFWMKNTPHPLSIAYIDYKGKIRDIFDMTPYSEATIVSTVSVRYALEVPQGWFEKSGIKKGDFLELDL
ncbi:MAG: DUF192 domain-containing protein [Treponema sp.]|nr:DUF192 domain-containing protein [Treponema sp.]